MRKTNKILQRDGYAEIVAYYKKEQFLIKVSTNDLPILTRCYWGVTKYGYARGWYKTRNVFLHKILMPNGLVDHKDGDKLNNQRSNLRYGNKSVNAMNSKLPANSVSGVKGVCFDKRRNCWRAHIKINGKQIHLGQKKNFKEAVELRKNAEIRYFGEWRYHGG